MLIRLAVILVILFVVGFFVLKRRGIQVSLTPKGKSVLFQGVIIALRFLLRRIFGR